jgi:hypothetical protein
MIVGFIHYRCPLHAPTRCLTHRSS